MGVINMDYAVIIISAEEKDAANELCGQISEGGENTFTIGLSPNGQYNFFAKWLMVCYTARPLQYLQLCN